MTLRHARITTALAMLLMSLATVASADVLWDQSAISLTAPISMANYKLTGIGGGPEYTVNDITVPADGWNVTKITEYYGDYTGANQQVTAPTGYLIVMPKSGSLPSGAPSTSTVVNLTWTETVISGQPVYLCVANVNLNLAAGDYWITVSPIEPNDFFNGVNNQWPAAVSMGATCATYDTAWHNYYSPYDSAFMLEGSTGGATPTAATSWGKLKSLYR